MAARRSGGGTYLAATGPSPLSAGPWQGTHVRMNLRCPRAMDESSGACGLTNDFSTRVRSATIIAGSGFHVSTPVVGTLIESGGWRYVCCGMKLTLVRMSRFE